MDIKSALDVFLNPESVAVIGATDRPGSWGSFIMQGLLSRNYSGRIYPVNSNAKKVFGIPAFKEIKDIEGPISLVVITIPADSLDKIITDCGQRGAKGATIITAGYGESSEEGKAREKTLSRIGQSYGMHLLGPNVSGTFNLHADFNASASPAEHLVCNTLGAICQGGYAIYDLLASGCSRGMGVGKFVHTGNECDVTATDFLEYFGDDPDVEVILMYLETVRDARRFVELARRISKKKPIVVYKGGRTPGSARAAKSHTGALSGLRELYQGVFHQTGIIASPTMELLLPLGHAFLERPQMRGRRVAIVTMGGSWGVALSDVMEESGLTVPELSPRLQESLRTIGMPPRASTRNPVDIGASGRFFEEDIIMALGREILSSGEVDAMVLHGMGRPGMLAEDAPYRLKLFLEINKRIVKGFSKMENETGLPVLIGSIYTPWESQVVYDLNREGVRIYNRLDEIAQILSLMHTYWRGGQKR